MNKLNGKKSFYLKAIITPIVVMAIIFWLLHISPFGPKNFLVSDLATQYLQFFTELRRQLLHLHFSSYSFLVSIGDSAVPIYSYYLLSPFNLIIVLFKNDQLPVAIDLIIWLKIIFANISMSFFLARKYQKYDLMTIAAGVAYGLCGFVAMYFYDLMWLDALIMLPIVVASLERLVKKNRVWLYVFTLTYTIVTNYYMGYMICIFMVLYLVYLLINEKPEGMKFTKFAVTQKQVIGRFSWYSILAGGMSAIVLIPTGFAMMTTGKGSFELKSFIPIVSFGPSVLTNLGVGANNFNDRLFHDPSVFSGTLFIIGLICYFLSKQISRQGKQAAGFILTASFLGMWILPFNTIWHMFQQPAGFPFRMVYMLSFLIIMFGFEAYTKNVFENRQLVTRSTKYVVISLVIGYICANIFSEIIRVFNINNIQFSVNNWHLLVSFVFVVITSILMAGMTIQSKNKRNLLFLLVIFEMGTNFVLSTGGATFMNQRNYADAYNYSAKIINRDESDSIENGRVYRSLVVNQAFKSLYPNPYSGYNDSLIFQNRGVGSYSSTLNSQTHYVLENLGFSTRNIRRIDMLGGTEVTNHLLGVRNIITVDQHQGSTVQNNKVPSIGFMMNDEIKNLSFEKGMVFKNLNRVAQIESGKNYQYFKAPRILSVNKLGNGPYTYEMKFAARTDGSQYLYIPNIRLQGISIYVNDNLVSPVYSGLGTEVIPLGSKKYNEQYSVKVVSPNSLSGIENDVSGFDNLAFDRDATNAPISTLKFDNPKNINYQGDDFAGEIQVKQENQILFMSMPFDKGWHVTVNGQPGQVIRVADGLMGVELPQGNNRVHFKYEAGGLKVGLIISIMMLGLTIITAVVRIYRRKNVN